MFKIILLLFTPKRRGSPAPPNPSLTHSPHCPAELWDQTGAPPGAQPLLPACSPCLCLPCSPACTGPAWPQEGPSAAGSAHSPRPPCRKQRCFPPHLPTSRG